MCHEMVSLRLRICIIKCVRLRVAFIDALCGRTPITNRRRGMRAVPHTASSSLLRFMQLDELTEGLSSWSLDDLALRRRQAFGSASSVTVRRLQALARSQLLRPGAMPTPAMTTSTQSSTAPPARDAQDDDMDTEPAASSALPAVPSGSPRKSRKQRSPVKTLHTDTQEQTERGGSSVSRAGSVPLDALMSMASARAPHASSSSSSPPPHSSSLPTATAFLGQAGTGTAGIGSTPGAVQYPARSPTDKAYLLSKRRPSLLIEEQQQLNHVNIAWPAGALAAHARIGATMAAHPASAPAESATGGTPSSICKRKRTWSDLARPI